MTEETLNAIGEMGDALSELFWREAKAIDGSTDPRWLGRKEAYEACAEAVTKATTRRMIVWPEVAIKFTVPAEAKP